MPTHRGAPDVRVYPDPDALSRAVAQAIAGLIQTAVAEKDRFCMALSGGRAPFRTFRRLVEAFRDAVPWSGVHVFWADERYVPFDDSRSHYRMVREAFLDHVSIPFDQVHPMPTTEPDPETAARAYENLLRAYFPGPWPVFDLAILGLGADGHTASLFPGSPALAERERWVVAVREPTADPPVRLTLTLPVLNHAACIYFIVTGPEKTLALRRTLADAPDLVNCPAGAVRPVRGDLIWWVDQAAWGIPLSRADGALSVP
ncbi:MAG: 6-phosphogluconolactonase [Acidobacteria bacterium]|nr:6-phosphogluconolactonase [Acidobacteriota bacterium]MDW7983318.1 6-phosphogluconolactonase [Acidobacteriota bacterium]